MPILQKCTKVIKLYMSKYSKLPHCKLFSHNSLFITVRKSHGGFFDKIPRLRTFGPQM